MSTIMRLTDVRHCCERLKSTHELLGLVHELLDHPVHPAKQPPPHVHAKQGSERGRSGGGFYVGFDSPVGKTGFRT